MVAVSLGVEGMVCEEQEGRVNVCNALLLHFVRFQGLAAMILTPWGSEKSLMSLCTLASAISLHLKKRGKRGEELGVELP
jgi:hypothetical protein